MSLLATRTAMMCAVNGITTEALKTFVLALTLISTYWLAWPRIRIAAQSAMASRKNGCQRPPRYAHKDRCGQDLYDQMVQATAQGTQLAFATERYKAYGKTYASAYYGQQKIHTCDPRNMQAVFATDFDSYSATRIRRRANKGWFKHGIMIEDGREWAHSRQILAAAFKKSQSFTVEQLMPHIDRLMAKLPSDGSAVDLQPLLFLFFLDVSTEWLFGESSATLMGKSKGFDANTFIERFDDVQRLKQSRTYLGAFAWLRGTDPEYVKAYTDVNRVVDGFVSKATSDENSRPSFVRELTAFNKQPLWLRDQTLNVFQPARDGSAIGLADVFFHLARHPDVWTKMRRECMTVKEPIDSEKLSSLTYTRLVIRESLRLLSPVGRALRTAVKSTTLPTGGGVNGASPVFVPAGTEIECDWTVTQRDEEYWGPSASQFRPERWHSVLPRWEYIPFMGGPRICPAQRLVLTQYTLVLWRFANAYEKIECLDPVLEFVEEHRMSKKSRNGVIIGLSAPSVR